MFRACAFKGFELAGIAALRADRTCCSGLPAQQAPLLSVCA
jgi:hypothetical protein